MKKTIIYFFIILIFVAVILFFLGVRTSTYLSNTKDQSIKSKLFDIECEIFFDEVTNVPSVVSVNVFYNELAKEKKIKNLKIFPINPLNNDTLKRDTSLDNAYLLPNYWNNEMNLVITYDLDSSGVAIPQKVIFTKLKKITVWRMNFALH